jgi:transcriptional regulator with XRE-family HTH domain
MGVASIPQYRRILGGNIRAQRKQLGLSQETLSEKADLHPVYVGSVERGEENVSIDSLVRIAEALKVAVQDLVNGI